MTWTINVNGHDDLSGDEKIALETVIAGEALSLVESLKVHKGNIVSGATVTTNTTGFINLLQ